MQISLQVPQQFQKIHPLVYLTVLYWLISLILFQKLGIQNVNDSDRYLAYAKNLHGGFYFEEHNFWYFGYVFFVYLNSLVSTSVTLLISSQYVLGYLSLIALYKTSKLLFNGRSAAIYSSLLYLLFIDILSWNSYILAESFFTSMTCFSLYYLALLFKKKRGLAVHSFGIPGVLLTFIAKPTGLVLLIALIVVALAFAFNRIRSQFFKWTIAGVVLLATLSLADKMLTTFQVIENYRLGEIIYAVKTVRNIPNLEGLVVEPSRVLTIPDQHESKIWMIIQFVWQNPLYWFELFFKKVFYFLFHVRPFWSTAHNIVSILFLIPSYFLFFKNALGKLINKQLALFSIVYVLMHAVSIGLTSVDWDGRFLIPVLPLVFLLAGSELQLIVTKKPT